ncbi:MAG: hypothetical protein ACR2PY_08105 [Salinispira sp.]
MISDMEKTEELAVLAIGKIREKFPDSFFSLLIEEDYEDDFEDDNYYVIAINDSELYFSDEYLQFVFDLSEEMRRNSVYNVLFVCNSNIPKSTVTQEA